MGQRIAWLLVVGGSLFVQGLIAISGVLSARLLGVDGRGEVALVGALSGMAAQLTLGGSLPNALTKRLADRRTTTRDGIHHLLRPLSLISVASAVPFALLFVVIHGDTSHPYAWWLALTVGALAVLNTAYRLVIAGLLGESSPLMRVAIAALLPQTLVTLAILVLFLVEQSSDSLTVLVIMVGATTLGTVVAIAMLAPRRAGAVALDGEDLWRLTRSTYVGSIGPLDGLGLDRALVGALLGTSVLGLYSAASAMALLTGALGTGLSSILLPRLAAAQSEPDLERRLVRRWLALGALVLGVVTVGLVAIAKPVIEIAFGMDFAAAVPVALWLVPASGILAFRRILIIVLQGRERGGVASWIELALTPVLVACILVAGHLDSTVAVGQAMLVVAVAAVVLLGLAVARTSPHREPTSAPARRKGGRHKVMSR